MPCGLTGINWNTGPKSTTCFTISLLLVPAEQGLLALGALFRQTSHVRNQIGQLIVRELAAISRHLGFSFFCDFQKLGIWLLLDFRALEILDRKFFAGYAARGVRAVADLAL